MNDEMKTLPMKLSEIAIKEKRDRKLQRSLLSTTAILKVMILAMALNVVNY